MPNLARRLSSLLVVALMLSACAEDKTVIIVTVDPRPTIRPASSLRVTWQLGNENVSQTLSGTDQIFTMSQSVDFGVLAPDRTGMATLTVEALDSNQSLVGQGSQTFMILPDVTATITVRLEPESFVANADFVGNQTFPSAGTARQVAAQPNGDFALVWDDNEQGSCGITPCQPEARLFSGNTLPRVNATSNQDGDFRLPLAPTTEHEGAAIAMLPSGEFMTAYVRFPLSAFNGPEAVITRAFSATGAPQATTSEERELTAPTVFSVGFPDIAALSSGQFVVVWAEETTEDVVGIFGTILDTRNDRFGVGNFMIASVPSTGPVQVSVAAGDGSFLVVWSDSSSNSGGDLHGAILTNDGNTSAGPFDIAFVQTGRAVAADATATINGYAVVWDDLINGPPDSDDRAIRMRRFSSTGAPLDGTEFTVNTTFTGEQLDAAIAQTTDGNLLVTWTSMATAVDPAGGVRARRVLSFGLPVGDEFSINTRQDALQSRSSVVGMPGAGFLVAYADQSTAGPDTTPGGIRARVVYPSYETNDGKIGSRCTATSDCDPTLACASAQDGQRCYRTCQGGDTSCTSGGKCIVTPASEMVCLY